MTMGDLSEHDEQAAKTLPISIDELVQQGDDAREARNWERARAHYEEALRLVPERAPIWIQLGHAAKELGDSVAAEQAYRTALILNPADADGHLQFGHLMKITDRMSAAVAFYSHALKLDPGLDDARKELNRLRRRSPEEIAKIASLALRSLQDHHEARPIFSSPLAGPDFLCIGTAKAGTGWLFDQLRSHPDIWMPPIKEFAYLKRESGSIKKNVARRLEQLRSGIAPMLSKWSNRRSDDRRDLAFLEEAQIAQETPLDLASYGALFRHKENALSGDVTPGYASLDESLIARLESTFPHMKLILMVRDPIDRVWSRLSMWARLGSFDPEITEHEQNFAEFLATSPRLEHESFQTAILEKWRRFAPNLALRHFVFDDLVKSPGNVLHDIVEFVGADPSKTREDLLVTKNRKARKEKLVMSATARAVLVQHFRQELRASAELFGGAAKEWPARYGLTS